MVCRVTALFVRGRANMQPVIEHAQSEAFAGITTARTPLPLFQVAVTRTARRSCLSSPWRHIGKRHGLR